MIVRRSAIIETIPYAPAPAVHPMVPDTNTGISQRMTIAADINSTWKKLWGF